MAFFEVMCASYALGKQVSVNVVIPDEINADTGKVKFEHGYKTLYLFHGLSDDHTIWSRRTCIERYADRYKIAVVMPNVDKSWYTDTVGNLNYLTFVAKELPAICRGFFKGMSTRREDTLVAGLSMGGYGAIKTAMTAPETFGGCASLSGALDITFIDTFVNINELRAIFGFDINGSAELAGTKHDIFELVKLNKEKGVEFPKLYLWCGDHDFLIESNRKFDKHLASLGIDYVYKETEGTHGWGYWDTHIQDALKFLLDIKE